MLIDRVDTDVVLTELPLERFAVQSLDSVQAVVRLALVLQLLGRGAGAAAECAADAEGGVQAALGAEPEGGALPSGGGGRGEVSARVREVE